MAAPQTNQSAPVIALDGGFSLRKIDYSQLIGFEEGVRVNIVKLSACAFAFLFVAFSIYNSNLTKASGIGPNVSAPAVLGMQEEQDVGEVLGSTSPCGQYGDVDGNGSVTSADYILINRHVVGIITLSAAQQKRADVNGDLKITTVDQLLVQNYISGIQITFPVCADRDSDGFTDAVESYIGTDPNKACGTGAWPPDFNNDGVVDILDVMKYKSNTGIITTTAAQRRLDLDANGYLNSSDVLKLKPYMLTTCTPLPTPLPTPPPTPPPTPLPTPPPTPLPTPNPTANLLPDLTVTNFALSKANPAPGEAVTASITLKNQGAMVRPCGSFGDVDLNGYITSADPQLILKYVSGTTTLSPTQKLIADVTMDFATTGIPIVNSNDSLIILRFLDNSLGTFPVCQTITPPTQPFSGPFLYTFYNNVGTAFCNSAGQISAAIPGLKAGESTSFNISFSAPANAGSFSVRIFADSTCIVNETNNDNNQAIAGYSVSLPCSGTPVLQIVPTNVEQGKNIELSAGGLSNCASSDVIKFDSTTGGGTWDKPLKNCNLGSTGACSVSFTADWSPGGPYNVRALLDKGGDGSIEGISNVVDVTVTASVPQPPPGPQPQPGACGDLPVDSSIDGMKKYLECYLVAKYGTRNPTVALGPVGGSMMEVGSLLWGLSGCETGGTWNAMAYAGPSYYEKGLFQYQAKNIAGYPDSPFDTWGSAARSSGLGSNIWDFRDQFRVTEWKVRANGGNDVDAWSCFNNLGYRYYTSGY